MPAEQSYGKSLSRKEENTKLTLKLIISILLITSFATLTNAIYIEEPPGDYPPWYWYETPNLPEAGNCDDTIFHNITPYLGEEDVSVSNPKGVQICINITPPSGCNLTIILQWINYTQYYNDWISWASEQNWGYIDEWGNWTDDIDWDNQTNPYNSSYWYNFSNLTTINSETQLCAYNPNATCRIENDFTTMYFDWRINWTLNCTRQVTTGDCYYYFQTELCEGVREIQPPSPNGTACPCCDCLCIVIDSYNPVNLTFYRNDTQFPTYYIINKLFYVTSGEYCFCLDGHNYEGIYFPNNYNMTYNWYVNINDTVTKINESSEIFTYRTMPNPSYCPCGVADIEAVANSTDNISDETWILPIAMMFVFITPFIIQAYRRNKK